MTSKNPMRKPSYKTQKQLEEENRYKAQEIEGYKPLFKDLHKQYPTKNYQIED